MKKTCVNSTHHKKRTSKGKVSATESHKSKTVVDREADTAKCKVSADNTTSEATTSRAAELGASKASPDNCTETAASSVSAEKATGAVTTAGEDSSVPLPSTAAPTHKPNVSRAAELAASKASPDNCTETAASSVSAEKATGAVATAGEDSSVPLPSTAAPTHKPNVSHAAELGASKASPDNCTETAKSTVSVEKATGAVATAATPGEDNSVPLPSTAAPTHKPNVVFIDSINSFRYSSEWHSPSKVLP